MEFIKNELHELYANIETDKEELLKNVEQLQKILSLMADEIKSNKDLPGNSAARFEQNSHYIYTAYTVIQNKEMIANKLKNAIR